MNNKNLNIVIGIVVLILVIVLTFLIFTNPGLFFVGPGSLCADGQGTTIYISKSNLLNNLQTVEVNELIYNIPLSLSDGFIAITTTDPCGKRLGYIIVEKDVENKVSKDNFDQFITNYNAECDNCLFELHQSGNSPVFITEFSSKKEFLIVEENGNLVLTEFVSDCGIIEVMDESREIDFCFENALSACSPSKILLKYYEKHWGDNAKEIEINILGDDSAFCSINYTYKFNDGTEQFVKCNLPTYGDLFSEKSGYELFKICESQNNKIINQLKK